MAILNTATSIVDFLKSQGKSSDFTSRTALYESSGLKDAFGDYRGTPEQNTTLLKKLSTPAEPSTTISPPTGPAITAKDVIDQTGPSTISSAFDLQLSDAEKAAEAEKKGLTFDLAASTARGAETVKRDVATLQRTAQEGISELALKGTQAQERVGEQAAGFGGAFSGVTKKSQAEIAQEVSTKQTSIRAKLGDQLYDTFSDFEKNFGTKFLESLSIPEAQQFVKLPAPVRGVVMNQYQEAVAKAEEKAQKSALSTLEKLGYTVIGGQIVQTLAGRSAERADEAAVRSAATAGKIVTTIGGRKVLFDKATGEVVQDLGPSSTGSGVTVVTTPAGEFKLTDLINKEGLARLKANGIPDDITADLAQSIASGADLEDIRNALRADAESLRSRGIIKPGEDPIKVLDRFDTAVNIADLRNVKKSSGFTIQINPEDIQSLLNE